MDGDFCSQTFARRGILSALIYLRPRKRLDSIPRPFTLTFFVVLCRGRVWFPLVQHVAPTPRMRVNSARFHHLEKPWRATAWKVLASQLVEIPRMLTTPRCREQA